MKLAFIDDEPAQSLILNICSLPGSRRQDRHARSRYLKAKKRFYFDIAGSSGCPVDLRELSHGRNDGLQGFYESGVYSLLEQEDTKVWRISVYLHYLICMRRKKRQETL